MKRKLSILFAAIAVLSVMVFASASVEAATLATPTVTKTEAVTSGIKLTWNKVSGAAKYRVFLHNGTQWKKLADTTATSYTYPSVKSGTSYKFTVRCVSNDGKSFTSGYNKTGWTQKFITAPAVSKIQNVESGVQLTYNKPNGTSKIRVFRKMEGTGWKKLADTTATTYTDKTAVNGTPYIYTVRCVSSDGKVFESGYKTAGWSITRLWLATPSVTSLSVNSNGGINIRWSKVSNCPYYRLFYRTNGSGWKRIADVTGTSYIWNGAVSGTTYEITVRCISADKSCFISNYNSGLTITYLPITPPTVKPTQPPTQPATQAPTEKPTEVVVDAPKNVKVTGSTTGKKEYAEVVKYGYCTNLMKSGVWTNVGETPTSFWKSQVENDLWVSTHLEQLGDGKVRFYFDPVAPDKVTSIITVVRWGEGDNDFSRVDATGDALKLGYCDHQLPVVSTTNPSINVSWTASSNADSYEVRALDAKGNAVSSVVRTGKGATSATVTLNTANAGSYNVEVKAIKGSKSATAKGTFSLNTKFITESEGSTIKVPVIFQNTRFVCNKCGREVGGKVLHHIIPIDSTELREKYADSLYTYQYKPTAGKDNAWVAAWAGTPDVTLTAGYYDLGDYFYRPMFFDDTDPMINYVEDDSLERPVSMSTKFSLAELEAKINNCGVQTYINSGTNYWLNCTMSSFHEAIEGCSSAYHSEDCISISGLQEIVIPATGYTKVTVG